MKGVAEVIVILYNNPEVEERCLASVRQHTDLGKHTLTVVDNYVRDKNLGALWNEIIDKSKADYICLLNSDTTVEPLWLEKLIEAQRKTNAQAVGPMTTTVANKRQKGPRANKIVDTTVLGGFCLLMPRAAFHAAGGFREDFTFYGQESDLLKRLGKKVINQDVFVEHEGRATARKEGRLQEEGLLRNKFWPYQERFGWTRHRIAIIGAGPGNPFPLWKGIDQAVVEFGRERCAAKHFPLATVGINDLKDFRPNVIIVANTTLPKVKNLRSVLGQFPRVPKGLWFCDLRPGERGADVRGMFNKVFLCFQDSPGFSWALWHRNTGAEIRYMPQGSVINTELQPLRIEEEVLFIGNTSDHPYHLGRAELVEKLKARVVNESLRSLRIGVERDSPRLYRRARFSLVVSNPVAGYNSLRLYNVGAYGGLPLVRTFPNAERIIKHEHRGFLFRKAEDAQALINRWKGAEEECEKIRKRNWRHNQALHTVMIRLMNMVSCLTTGDRAFWGFD